MCHWRSSPRSSSKTPVCWKNKFNPETCLPILFFRRRKMKCSKSSETRFPKVSCRSELCSRGQRPFEFSICFFRNSWNRLSRPTTNQPINQSTLNPRRLSAHPLVLTKFRAEPCSRSYKKRISPQSTEMKHFHSITCTRSWTQKRQNKRNQQKPAKNELVLVASVLMIILLFRSINWLREMHSCQKSHQKQPGTSEGTLRNEFCFAIFSFSDEKKFRRLLKNNWSRRCDQNRPKIVEIKAILAIFRTF